MEIKRDINLIDECNYFDYILVSVNINHSMRHGFAEDIKVKYPYVHEENLKTSYGDLRKLGTILECGKDNEQKVILLFMSKGYPKRNKKNEVIDFLDYGILKHCLKLINVKYKGKKIACPLLGCSRFDGNGNKEAVLKLIEKELRDVDITVYDFYEKSRDEKKLEIYHKNKKK